SRPVTLTVLAASPLVRVLPQLGAMYTQQHAGVSFRFSFASTDALAARLRQGASADVFAGVLTGSSHLSSTGLVDAATPFCTSRGTTYVIAVVAASKNAAAAQRFLDYVMSAPAQTVLRKAGFGPPPPG
ncbi:MAG TPA: substrate-binding domain-containing protein, partial [Actinomycetota bacterium]|nr:substrate-binding domain-containing protein [Actinomycetota bacterium]